MVISDVLHSRRAALAFLATAAAASPALARGPEIYTPTLSSLAAGGHDVVAFFSQGRPVEGSREFTHRWKSATWRFANAANRDAFVANPERYAPAYGGHCAWAASRGYRAAGDPRHWRIENGRLFLNYDARVHSLWLADSARMIVEADRRWPNL